MNPKEWKQKPLRTTLNEKQWIKDKFKTQENVFITSFVRYGRL